MKELKYKDYDTVSYMSYELVDTYSLSVLGELGAISFIDSNNYRGWSYRLIVGGYKINDENFRDQSQDDNYSNGGFGSLFPLFPLENDYFGIRRAFWLNSNDIYKRAGANHKGKMNLIQNGKIPETSLSYDDFVPAPAVNINISRQTNPIKLDSLTKKVRSLSNLYYEYPGLCFSEADISLYRNDVFYVSSEGSFISFPMDLTTLSINLSAKNEKDEQITNILSIMALSVDKLPTKENLKTEIDLLAENLIVSKKTEDLKEAYSGPVLFDGQITASVFIRNLFTPKRSLFAERNNLVSSNNGEVFYEEIENKWQSKVGKKIIASGVSILAKPTLKTWNGKHLFGSYPVDSEGVIPNDSIVLVSDGILRGFLSSRTPTSVTDSSNGHKRYFFTRGGVGHFRGPSVTVVEASENKAISELKSELIKMAKEEGLDYAIIIRSLPSDIAIMPVNYYKVDLESGTETRIGNIIFSDQITDAAMKSTQFSKETIVTNLFFNNSYRSDYDYMDEYAYYPTQSTSSENTGLPVSYIGPKAMLVNDFELRLSSKKDMIHKEKERITNPLER
nr:hypothetical protein [Bacteroidota bacterium]